MIKNTIIQMHLDLVDIIVNRSTRLIKIKLKKHTLNPFVYSHHEIKKIGCFFYSDFK